MDATLIIKYPTPTTKPLQFWRDLFPALQISPVANAPDRQEFSVRSSDALNWSQILLDVWKALPMEDLEWADLLFDSSRLRVRGGGLTAKIESLSTDKEHS